MDAAGTDDSRDLSVHKGRVAALRLGACDGAMARTMVVQELTGEVPASNRHGSATSHVAVNQEGSVLSQGPKLRQHVLATSNHLIGVICRDVGAEELRLTGLLDAHTHGLDDLRDALVHLAEDLIALRLIVLDEIATLPEGIAGLTEWLWLQTQLGLDNGAHHKATVGHLATQDAPHVNDVAGWAIKEPQVSRGEVHVIDL